MSRDRDRCWRCGSPWRLTSAARRAPADRAARRARDRRRDCPTSRRRRIPATRGGSPASRRAAARRVARAGSTALRRVAIAPARHDGAAELAGARPGSPIPSTRERGEPRTGRPREAGWCWADRTKARRRPSASPFCGGHYSVGQKTADFCRYWIRMPGNEPAREKPEPAATSGDEAARVRSLHVATWGVYQPGVTAPNVGMTGETVATVDAATG